MQEKPPKGFVVGLLLIVFVATLTSTIIIPALPSLIRDLDGTQISLIWIVTSQLLAMTVSLPIWGKLSDIYPHHRNAMLKASVICFLVASIIAGLSSSILVLDIARVIQGVGAGGVIALGQMVVSQYSKHNMVSLVGVSVGIAALSGPLLGGIIVEHLSWRWVFLLPILPGLFGLVCLKHMPKVSKPKVKLTFPLTSSFLFSIYLSLFVVWLSLAKHSYQWISLTSLLLLSSVVTVFIIWVFVERKSQQKLFPYSQLITSNYTYVLLLNIGIGVILFCSIMFLSQFLQLAKGLSAVQIGVYTLPLLVGLVLTVLISEKIKNRISSQTIILVGTVLTTISLILLSFSLKNHMPLFVVLSISLGAGIGCMIQTVLNFVEQLSLQKHSNNLSSILSSVTFLRTLSGTISIAVLGNILNNQTLHKLQMQLEHYGIQIVLSSKNKIPNFNLFPPQYKAVLEEAYTSSVNHLFILLTVFAVIFLLIPALLLFVKKEKI